LLLADLVSETPLPKENVCGFTVDPARRVEEHNGMNNRGAIYTEDFRPWIPVCVVQGFSSYKIALKCELADILAGVALISSLTLSVVEYAWQHLHSSRYVKKIWWDTNEPPQPCRGRRAHRVSPGVGTPCSARHKLLEMNLLLWLRGDDIPWGNDKLSVIYTSERSRKWARELGNFSRFPSHVQR